MKTGLIIGIAAIAAGGAFYLYKRNANNTIAPILFTTPTTTVPKPTALLPSNTATAPTWGLGHDKFPLQKGSYGDNVKLVQAWCNKLGSSLTVDGKYGNNTVAAVKRAIGSEIVALMQFTYLKNKANA